MAEYLSTDPNAGSGGYLSTDPNAGFESLPKGAAIGNPTLSRQRRPRNQIEPGVIAGATVLGGIAGAVAPEILTGIAGVAGSFPATAPAASALNAAASAVRAVGRPMSALGGAASGLGSETAGQVAESAGSPRWASETARFVGGAIGGEAANFGKFITEKILQAPALSIEHKVNKEIARKVYAKLTRDPESLDDVERKWLDARLGELRGSGSPGDFDRLYRRLDDAATAKLSASQGQANDIMNRALTVAEREKQAVQSGLVPRVTEARNRISQAAGEALAVGQQQRLSIAPDAELSDIGSTLRNRVVERNAAALAKREQEYQAIEAQRNAIVAQREGAGQYVKDVPSYPIIIKELEDQLKPGKHSADVADTFRRILSDLKTKRGPEPVLTERQVLGYDPRPSAQETPVSFNAVDEVRRKLGEVFRGSPPEGYKAIDAGTARRYYAKLGELQREFAGDPQSRLMASYREGSEGLNQFATKAGEKLTAVDRFDENRFRTDASALPKQFFASKQGVSDLIELTGDRAVVVNAAKQFAVNELRDKSATQVRTWMNSRRELLSSLPELQRAVAGYASSLDRGELINRSATKALGKLPKVEAGAIAAAETRGRDAIAVARQTGNAITAAAEKEAGILTGNKFPVDRLKSLVERGDRREWKLVGTQISWSPQSRAELESVVRQVMAEKAAGSVKGTLDLFERKVRPAVEETGLMTRKTTDAIANKLREIEQMKIPEQQRLGIMKRAVIESFAGYGSGLAPRGASAIDNLIGNLTEGRE